MRLRVNRIVVLMAVIYGILSVAGVEARSRKETKIVDNSQIVDEVDAIEARFLDSSVSTECTALMKKVVADVRLGNTQDKSFAGHAEMVKSWNVAYDDPNNVKTAGEWIRMFGIRDLNRNCKSVEVLFMSQYAGGTKMLSLAQYDLSGLNIAPDSKIFGRGIVSGNTSTEYVFKMYAGGHDAGTKVPVATNTEKEFVCIGGECVVATLAEAFEKGWLTPESPVPTTVKRDLAGLFEQKRLQKLEAYRAEFRMAVSSKEFDAFISKYAGNDQDSLLPAARSKKTAALLREYREAFKAAYSTATLDDFMEKYSANDPDKLVPQAKKLRVAAAVRENREREEAERRWQADAPRRQHNAICDANYFTCKAGCNTIVGSHYEAWDARNKCEQNCSSAKSSCSR